MGTSRSRSPLPMTLTKAPSSERSSRSRPRASLTRRPGGIEQLEQRPVSDVDRVAGIVPTGGLEDRDGPGDVERLGQAANGSGQVDPGGQIPLDQLVAVGEAVEAADRRGPPPEARRGGAVDRPIRRGGGPSARSRWPSRRRRRGRRRTGPGPGVGPERRRREPALDPQVEEVRLDRVAQTRPDRPGSGHAPGSLERPGPIGTTGVAGLLVQGVDRPRQPLLETGEVAGLVLQVIEQGPDLRGHVLQLGIQAGETENFARGSKRGSNRARSWASRRCPSRSRAPPSSRRGQGGLGPPPGVESLRRAGSPRDGSAGRRPRRR